MPNTNRSALSASASTEESANRWRSTVPTHGSSSSDGKERLSHSTNEDASRANFLRRNVSRFHRNTKRQRKRARRRRLMATDEEDTTLGSLSSKDDVSALISDSHHYDDEETDSYIDGNSDDMDDDPELATSMSERHRASRVDQQDFVTAAELLEQQEFDASHTLHPLFLTFQDPDVEARYFKFAYVTSKFIGGKLWFMASLGITLVLYIWYHGVLQGWHSGMLTSSAWIPLLLNTILSTLLTTSLFVERLAYYRETIYLVGLMIHWPAFTIVSFYGMGEVWRYRFVFVIGCLFFCTFVAQARFHRAAPILLISPFATIAITSVVWSSDETNGKSYWETAGRSHGEIILWLSLAAPTTLLVPFEKMSRRAFTYMERAIVQIEKINYRMMKTEDLITCFFARTPTLDFLSHTTIDHRPRLYQESVLIYTDLVSFTKWSSAFSAQHVTTHVGSMFRQIDAIAPEYGVEKIMTVGDAYIGAIFPSSTAQRMQVGVTANSPAAPRRQGSTTQPQINSPGLNPLNNPNHSPNIEDIKLNTNHNNGDGFPQRCANSLVFGSLIMNTGDPLAMRIGIAAGNVIVAFVGTQPPRFDIFGEVADHARDLEANADPGTMFTDFIVVEEAADLGAPDNPVEKDCDGVRGLQFSEFVLDEPMVKEHENTGAAGSTDPQQQVLHREVVAAPTEPIQQQQFFTPIQIFNISNSLCGVAQRELQERNAVFLSSFTISNVIPPPALMSAGSVQQHLFHNPAHDSSQSDMAVEDVGDDVELIVTNAEEPKQQAGSSAPGGHSNVVSVLNSNTTNSSLRPRGDSNGSSSRPHHIVTFPDEDIGPLPPQIGSNPPSGLTSPTSRAAHSTTAEVEGQDAIELQLTEGEGNAQSEVVDDAAPAAASPSLFRRQLKASRVFGQSPHGSPLLNKRDSRNASVAVPPLDTRDLQHPNQKIGPIVAPPSAPRNGARSSFNNYRHGLSSMTSASLHAPELIIEEYKDMGTKDEVSLNSFFLTFDNRENETIYGDYIRRSGLVELAASIMACLNLWFIMAQIGLTCSSSTWNRSLLAVEILINVQLILVLRHARPHFRLRSPSSRKYLSAYILTSFVIFNILSVFPDVDCDSSSSAKWYVATVCACGFGNTMLASQFLLYHRLQIRIALNFFFQALTLGMFYLRTYVFMKDDVVPPDGFVALGIAGYSFISYFIDYSLRSSFAYEQLLQKIQQRTESKYRETIVSALSIMLPPFAVQRVFEEFDASRVLSVVDDPSMSPLDTCGVEDRDEEVEELSASVSHTNHDGHPLSQDGDMDKNDDDRSCAFITREESLVVTDAAATTENAATTSENHAHLSAADSTSRILAARNRFITWEYEELGILFVKFNFEVRSSNPLLSAHSSSTFSPAATFGENPLQVPPHGGGGAGGGAPQPSSSLFNVAQIRRVNDVFVKIEQILRQHNVHKIKSIGQSVLCVSGIDDTLQKGAAIHPGQADATQNCVPSLLECALAIRTALREYPDCQFQLGLNFGPSIGAVLGRKSLMFDVFGDTVNVASRLCNLPCEDPPDRLSPLENARIFLSENVKSACFGVPHLANQIRFKERRHVKGKGELDVFQFGA